MGQLKSSDSNILPGLPGGSSYSAQLPKLFGNAPGIRDGGWRFAPDKEGNPTPDEKEAAALKQLSTWLETETAGLRGNRDTILGEKQGLEQKLREIGKQWEGLDPVRIRSIMAKFDGDEELKLIAEGKFEDVIKRRTDNMRTGLESERDAARTRIGELESAIGRKAERIKSLTIDAEVREIGLSMATPIDARGLTDAIRAAREIFTLNDEDAVIARRADGSPIIGKDGKSPLGIKEWLTSTFEGGKTLWWGASSGGGANGGGGNKSRSKADAAALDKMSPRAKLIAGMAASEEAA